MDTIRPVQLLAGLSHPAPKMPESWDHSQWEQALGQIQTDLQVSLEFIRSQLEHWPLDDSELAFNLCAGSKAAIEALKIQRQLVSAMAEINKIKQGGGPDSKSLVKIARIKEALRSQYVSMMGSISVVFDLLDEGDLRHRLPVAL